MQFQSLWFRIIMVIVVSIVAHYMDYVVLRWSIGWAWPTPFHFEDSVLPCAPKMISLVCGELYI